mmetsp:Transcript_53122/g.153282  ORF Transcript_53122/g.153282 Transcript_53122/m.153282 type:complete len:216 (+) Transcript_53122:230-877(+)
MLLLPGNRSGPRAGRQHVACWLLRQLPRQHVDADQVGEVDVDSAVVAACTAPHHDAELAPPDAAVLGVEVDHGAHVLAHEVTARERHEAHAEHRPPDVLPQLLSQSVEAAAEARLQRRGALRLLRPPLLHALLEAGEQLGGEGLRRQARRRRCRRRPRRRPRGGGRHRQLPHRLLAGLHGAVQDGANLSLLVCRRAEQHRRGERDRRPAARGRRL